MADFLYKKLPTPLKTIFSCLQFPFWALVQLRLWLYRSQVIPSYKSTAKVISVGNISLGGTGKSPMVSWLIDYFLSKDQRVAVLTRGYRSGGKECEVKLLKNGSRNGGATHFGDEPWMLHLRHPDVPIFVGKKRVESVKIAEIDADIILLDDGFSHLKLKRDLEITLVDSTRGFGNGLLLPFGPLREPPSSLVRSDTVILTKTNQPNKLDLTTEIAQFTRENTPVFSSIFEPVALMSSKGGEVPLNLLQEKSCFIASTIANPASFRETLEGLGAKIEEQLVLPDHQEYGRNEIEKLYDSLKTGLIFVVSEKDWAKLQENSFELPEFYWLKMKNQLPPDFTQFLDEFF
ncbi:MAG: tetraacyldisaccharide 4'-kinase [SAR324 cluster bacterium]|nr:tetraacyldisaccharide 4'-kinase [SAR324 cluster bacterium]